MAPIAWHLTTNYTWTKQAVIQQGLPDLGGNYGDVDVCDVKSGLRTFTLQAECVDEGDVSVYDNLLEQAGSSTTVTDSAGRQYQGLVTNFRSRQRAGSTKYDATITILGVEL